MCEELAAVLRGWPVREIERVPEDNSVGLALRPCSGGFPEPTTLRRLGPYLLSQRIAAKKYSIRPTASRYGAFPRRPKMHLTRNGSGA